MKVLLIEDSPEIGKGVILTFKLRWPDVTVIIAENGRKGLAQLETEFPDIVILDINLPDISGFEVLENIRKFSDVPVIILTVRDDEVDELRGLEMGADDYIVKPFSPSNLLIRCKAVLRRSGKRSTDDGQLAPISVGNIYINFNTNEYKVDNKNVHLTPNENRILYSLARNENKIIPQDTIKQQVWGNQAKYIDNSSLKRYIYQLRLKLGDDAEDPKLIINERGIGYRFIRPS